jgi:hypothetical protein
VLVCSERKVLLTGLLVAGLFREKITSDWWLISQTNRAAISYQRSRFSFTFHLVHVSIVVEIELLA